MQDRHHIVGRVAQLWAMESHLAKIMQRFPCWALINYLTLRHQNQSVEQVEQLSTGLVDCHDHILAFLPGQLPQVLHDDESRQRI